MKKNRIGQKFGKLTLIQYIKSKKYLCKCECKKEKIISTNNLIKGHTKSCGCIKSIYSSDYDENIKNKIKLYIKVNENNCWEWQKSKSKQGYGHCAYKRKVMLAHRVSWMVFKSKIPDGLLVLHKCDNPCCVNPDHLWLGSDSENALDAYKKGLLKIKKGIDQHCSKLNNEKVLHIRLLGKQGMPQRKIAKKFEVSKTTIGCILSGKSWKHVQ